MANIIITSTTNSIKVDFGVYATQLEMIKATWQKRDLMSFVLRPDGILVDISHQVDWLVSFDGSVGTLQIDSIDAVAPISNSDLYDKLTALIA